MELAYLAARRLESRVLNDNLGYFLLGSTSPDIRVITRRTREEYHFVELDFQQIGEGVESMFASHPRLRVPGALDYQTQAFMAGYITHLVADETWIVTMFRRYFGNPDVFSDDATGLVMDRAVQMELDRRAWDTVIDNRSQLREATENIDIGFIPTQTLFEWRDWILNFLDRGFTWERLGFMARRIARGEESHPAYQVAADFIGNPTERLSELYEIVPSRDLQDYKERTVESLVGYVRDYIS
jgi:hypothetical protein